MKIFIALYYYLENEKPVVDFSLSFPDCRANPRYNNSNVTLLKSSSLGQNSSTWITSLGWKASGEKEKIWKLYLYKLEKEEKLTCGNTDNKN